MLFIFVWYNNYRNSERNTTERRIIMDKKIARLAAWNEYKKTEFTSKMIICFTYAESKAEPAKMYAMAINSHDLEMDSAVKLDHDSTKNGGGLKIRFQPGKMTKYKMIQKGAIPFMTAEQFTEMFMMWRKETGKNYNQGEFFEKLVTEWNGEKWEKDNVPYTVAGDVIINGTSYQIKKEGAQIATLKQLGIE